MNRLAMKKSLERFPVVKRVALCVWRACKYPFQRNSGRKLAAEIASLEEIDVPTIWYFGRPSHPNLGDQAQRVCIERWIRDNYPGCRLFPIITWSFFRNPRRIVSELQKKVRPNDLFVMQSGYTMNDENPDEVAHRVIPRSFPDHKVVFLPQTVRYEGASDRDKTREALCGRRNVLLLARDRVSFRTACELFPDVRIELFPDIVTSLIGTRRYDHARQGVLFCMRNDVEKYYADDKIDSLMLELAKKVKVERTDTSVGVHSVDWDDCESVVRALEDVFDHYSRFEAIVTDRYHGTIFSLIAGTPVVVLKTTDHKVVTGAEWFEGVYDGYVSVADSLDEVPGIISQVISSDRSRCLEPYFQLEYYARLKSLINSLK
ncbi:MAG TPA: polysaccharide pyruvyl transferase family protein [Candidatus Rubneribacter avistercoris]|nr:polysaccharide pyruvyl transferase family protein [Candidatus Rubneribacter avistercoris]